MNEQTEIALVDGAGPSGSFSLADGRYLVVRRIAEGGTASVHLAYDTRAATWRAVKILLPEFARRPALRHRFEVEARTMMRLVHPNIIRVLDAGVDEDAAFMAMEFAEGGCLTDWVDAHGAMPPRMAVEIVLQLCAGIGAAHDRDVIHRDIKPHNVLVDKDGTCKVTDFGIAQVIQGNKRMTMTGTVMGTIGYMAPEQHESAKHTDARADVYSIASTLFTLLRGQPTTHLFMADRADFGDTPASLIQIMQRGSQYRRELRHESVAELAEELSDALEDLPPVPGDTPPLARPMEQPLSQEPIPAGAPPKPQIVEDSSDMESEVDLFGSLEPSPSVVERLDEPAAPPEPEYKPVALDRRTLTGPSAGPRLHYGSAVELERERRRNQSYLILASFFVAVLLASLVATGLSGAGAIGRSQVALHQSQEELVDVLLAEIAVVDDLRALKADVDEIEELFETLQRGEEVRSTTQRLVNLLQTTLREASRGSLSGQIHRVRKAEQTLERVDEAARAQRDAEVRLELTRNSFSGTVARVVRLAD